MTNLEIKERLQAQADKIKRMGLDMDEMKKRPDNIALVEEV